MFHMVKNDMFIFIYPCKLFCLFKNNFIRSNNIDDDDWIQTNYTEQKEWLH